MPYNVPIGFDFVVIEGGGDKGNLCGWKFWPWPSYSELRLKKQNFP